MPSSDRTDLARAPRSSPSGAIRSCWSRSTSAGICSPPHRAKRHSRVAGCAVASKATRTADAGCVLSVGEYASIDASRGARPLVRIRALRGAGLGRRASRSYPQALGVRRCNHAWHLGPAGDAREPHRADEGDRSTQRARLVAQEGACANDALAKLVPHIRVARMVSPHHNRLHRARLHRSVQRELQVRRRLSASGRGGSTPGTCF
jgi:hypothetical protein